MCSGLFKNVTNLFTNHICFIYMYKHDLILNNLPGFICNKTQTTN